MKIVLAGIIARYPFGGVTWCSMMYLLGLRDLGHEVFYLEDTGECIYDPIQNARTEDPAYGTAYIRDASRILVLHDGRVIAQGTHDELIVSNDLYRRMCARLSVGRSLDDPESVDELIQSL